MRVFGKEIPTRVSVLVGVLVIVAIVFGIMSCPKKQTITTIPAINAAQATIEKQLRKDIADRDNTINSLQAKVVAKDAIIKTSDNKYKIIVAKYTAQQKEKENVKIPTTIKEMRDRFIAAGFPALPASQCGAGTICFATGFK